MKTKSSQSAEFTKQTTQLNSGRQLQEKIYLDHYNQVQQLDKDKDIKFFQCIGDYPIEQYAIEDIKKERDVYNRAQLQEQVHNGITRYDINLNNDCAIVEEVLPKYECTWDFDKNDTLKIKRIKLKKIVSAVTRVIYRMRYEDRFQKIKLFLGGANNRE